MENRRTLVWFRNDLRVHDHEALYKASLKNREIIPVYIIDPRQFNGSQFGISRFGPFRRQFLIECLTDLRASLRALGGELYIRTGYPEEVIPDLAKALDVDQVFAHKEVTEEEVLVERKLEATLDKRGILLQWFEGATLVHPKELPFPLKFLPDIFTEFRKQVEKASKIYPPYPTPTQLKVPGGIQVGNIDLPLEAVASPFLPTPGGENLGGWAAKGGEKEGLARLHYYLWEADLLQNYKETRNGLLGGDYSSKFSAWLSFGALSPRQVYHEVKQYEAKRISNDSTYWLVFELLWRDYFRYVAKKYGNAIFNEGGTKNKAPKSRNNPELFARWAGGNTGAPFIDANMRELLATGFMSNRGRQNVASYLVKDLGLNWQLGAAWFEYLLVDYDPASNWGNWNYVAGVGNDPRENRYFNIAKQAETYDPKGMYIKTWVPELYRVPAYRLNHPDEWSRQEMKEYGITFGADYPYPVAKPQRQVA